MDTSRFRVDPGSKVDLEASDPRDTTPFTGDKRDGRAEAEALNERLEALQELLYAD